MRFILLAVLSAAPPPSPEGTWVSDGYGLVFQTGGGSGFPMRGSSPTGGPMMARG